MWWYECVRCEIQTSFNMTIMLDWHNCYNITDTDTGVTTENVTDADNEHYYYCLTLLWTWFAWEWLVSTNKYSALSSYQWYQYKHHISTLPINHQYQISVIKQMVIFYKTEDIYQFSVVWPQKVNQIQTPVLIKILGRTKTDCLLL